MPGIVGIVSDRPAEECQRLVAAMLACLRHERFYKFGTRKIPELGLYAGWTAHPGSFAHLECSRETQSDVSAILAGECETGDIPRLYRELGDKFVTELNGLFSGLVADRSRRRVLLFNDRYGLERVYIHETADTLYFASEAKALLAVLPELRAFDCKGVAQFLTYGCTYGQQTLFHGVELLASGSLWTIECGTRRRAQYFTPSTLEQQPKLTTESFNELFAETFQSVLPRYFGDGREVGISLTGGLDTRMILACLPKTSSPPISYTFAGPQINRLLDERLAGRLAAMCGLEHHVIRTSQEFLRDFHQEVDKTVYVTDGCSGAIGAHEVFLNRKARTFAPIRLTGNFGSEVLRGMSTFKPLGLVPELIHDDLRFNLADSILRARYQSPVTFAAFQEIPSTLFGPVAAARSQLTFRTPYMDNEIVTLAYQASDQIRQSSTSALGLVGRYAPRLARVPTDRGLVGEALGPGRMVRRLFAQVTFKLDYLHKEGMPHSLLRLDLALDKLEYVGLLGLHKYLSYRRWFRDELRPYVKTIFANTRARQQPFWNPDFFDLVAEDHFAGRRNYVREINAVITLEAVDRLLIHGFTTPITNLVPHGEPREETERICKTS
jgi:asparagine synthase (glutamine-hydrolysing)